MKNIRFNIQSDNHNLNDFLIVSESMGKIPNRIVIHDTFSGHNFENLIDNMGSEDKITFSEVIPTENGYYTNERILIKINESLWCSYTKIDTTSDNFPINEVCIYFKEHGVLGTLIEEIKECSIKFDDENDINKINTLSLSNGILELDPLVIDQSLDINDHHSKKNIKKIKRILKSIKNKNKSLSLIRGPRGCGKTYISKWISLKIDMISIFIPNNMIDHTINNPEFRNFLKRFEKCVLILDDCEFNYGFSKVSYLSGNIIQLLESLPIQNIHVIMIFNNDEDIDQDLLECNSLENNYYFGLMDPEFATSLSKRIGFDKVYKNNTSISNVFNNRKDIEEKIIGII